MKGLARHEDIDINYNRLREQILTFIVDIRALEEGKAPPKHMPMLSISSYEQSRRVFIERFQHHFHWDFVTHESLLLKPQVPV